MKPLLFFCALALTAPLTSTQVEHGGRAPSTLRPLRKAVPTARMAPVSAAALLAEDAAAPRTGALRFAEVLPVELGLTNAGVWEELGGGDRVWRLRLHSPGAKSIALVFARYQLPVGGELYVHSDDRRLTRGAYTELENQLDGTFAVRPVRGEAVTLEYFEPARARGRGELTLGLVAHDYRGVLDLIRTQDRSGSGSSGPCEIDVACPLGTGWDDQIDATVHVLALPGGLLCSGSLLNNTANDGTMLILSASHCGGLASAIFTFNFELPACGSGSAPTTNTLSGATQLVFDTVTDVQLVRVNVPQQPQPFPVYLAGWDRSDTPPASSVLIHHPAGDVKKISLDDDAPVRFQGFWRILDWEQGVSEGGSSGAPLFNPAKRFIGSLDSGSSSCVVPTDDDFCTRLATAWPLLEPYLDPLGTGAPTLDGLSLATVTPQVFSARAVVPAAIESLYPGQLRPVRIVGTGLTDTATLRIDGAPVAVERYLMGGHSWLALDPPQLGLGPHTLRLTQNGTNVDLPFSVVPPREPQLQVAEGNVGDPVFSFLGVDLLHADTPGHVHYCYWSTSNAPSIHPLLTLGLGNNFTSLLSCRIGAIPPSGWLAVHHAIRTGLLPAGTRVYTQSACVSHGSPLHTSGLQETEYQF